MFQRDELKNMDTRYTQIFTNICEISVDYVVGKRLSLTQVKLSIGSAHKKISRY